MIRGAEVNSEYHLCKTIEKFGEFLLAAAAVELYLSKYLRIILFLGETSVGILFEMRRDDRIFSNLKKMLVVAAIWARQAIGDFGLVTGRHI